MQNVFTSTLNGTLFRRALQLHLSARRESNERENVTGDENISELQSDEMLSGHMSVKTNLLVLSAVILCS